MLKCNPIYVHHHHCNYSERPSPSLDYTKRHAFIFICTEIYVSIRLHISLCKVTHACAGFKTTMFLQWKNIKLPFIAPCMLSSKILCMREKRRDADANNTMHIATLLYVRIVLNSILCVYLHLYSVICTRSIVEVYIVL